MSEGGGLGVGVLHDSHGQTELMLEEMTGFPPATHMQAAFLGTASARLPDAALLLPMCQRILCTFHTSKCPAHR